MMSTVEINCWKPCRDMVIVFNATFNNISVISFISWRSVLMVEETEYLEKTIDLSNVWQQDPRILHWCVTVQLYISAFKARANRNHKRHPNCQSRLHSSRLCILTPNIRFSPLYPNEPQTVDLPLQQKMNQNVFPRIVNAHFTRFL